jgi:acetoin utilization protein AcuB
LMNHPVITVTEDTPVPEAARVMLEKKIGGLPVLRQGQLTGMITVTDVLRAFLESEAR